MACLKLLLTKNRRLGVINNTLYVVILSAALDLVGPSIPKGVVLLADVIPSFFAKLIAPYFIHAIPYAVRIPILIVLSAGGMILIATSPPAVEGGSLSTKLIGIALASLSSGLGELSFLGLTHFYTPLSLAAWSSGTGGAGLIGAGAYVVTTNTFGLSTRKSLIAFAFLPFVMFMSFFTILPPPTTSSMGPTYESVAQQDDDEATEDIVEVDQAASSSQVLPPPTSNVHMNIIRARSLCLP